MLVCLYMDHVVNSSIVDSLNHPNKKSHKGQNGRVLVIAGSKKFHGSLLLTVQAASRIVDMVYVHSVSSNMELIQKLRSEIATFIAVDENELRHIMELVDCIMIGPGLEESEETVILTKHILTNYTHKKTVVDATSFWHLNPEWLHKNCVVTPHTREFENTFKCPSIKENVLPMAKKNNCTIILKGQIDYISDGEQLYENHTGNVGMTKGGTGDVLVGIVGSLLATNDILTSALAGTYLSGLAGDRLYERVGTFYNAEDVIVELGRIWKELIIVK